MNRNAALAVLVTSTLVLIVLLVPPSLAKKARESGTRTLASREKEPIFRDPSVAVVSKEKEADPLSLKSSNREAEEPRREIEANHSNGPTQEPQSGIISGTSVRNDVSPPLRFMKVLPMVSKEEEREANENPKLPSRHVDGADPVIQDSFASMRALLLPQIPSPIRNFDGILFPGVNCNCAPPDTNGEVGATQYVQMVNEGFQVFNKGTGASVFGPAGITTLWNGFGGVCENNGSGDPVVLYDQIANRWIITQFAGLSIPTDECIAVSTTNDATGTYNRYDFNLGTLFFDYPHLAVWPDAYYMSMNVFNSAGSAFLGPQAFAFNRTAMLAGTPATFVTPGITGGPTEDSFLPADLDGSTLPPAGAPASFVEWPGSGAYRTFHFHVDFGTPALSTFTLFASPAAAPFTELCPATRACVPQLGSTTNLDAIGDRLMFRLAYRNFGAFESVVGNYTVSANAVAGIRWFELRNVTAGPETVAQESTYQPDTTWRWMGSAAMDTQGNLAIGFSASSATINPQIRYAGRLVTDPVNTLAQGEAHLFDGTGSQTLTGSRWGDYSDLTVDPVDDCTFWYTQEYYSTTAAFNWRTRIGSFKFPNCLAAGQGTAHFTVTDCNTAAPVVGATVTVDGNAVGFTDATGTLDVALDPGTHPYSVTKPPLYGTASGNVNIVAATTTPVPVCLSGVPFLEAAGSSVVAESCAPSNGVIDPNETVTMSFTLANNGAASTSNLVATLQSSGGITPISGPQTYGAIPPSGNASKNFSFTVGNVGCGAALTATLQLQDGATNFGTVSYNLTTGVVAIALSENFDGVVAPALPAGWVAANALGLPPLWVTSPTTPDTAPNDAFVDDPATVSDKRLDTPGIAITSALAQVSFRNNYNLESTFDGGVLEVSSPNINAGAFTDITNVAVGGSFVSGGYNGPISSGFSSPIAGRQAWSGSSGGYITTVANLGPNVNGQTIKLRFRMASDSSVAGTGWRVDTLVVTNGFACCGSLIAASSPTAVSQESCSTGNNAIDPGETVTISLPVVNNGTTPTTNLMATLQLSGGVAAIHTTNPQSYGVVTLGGGAVSRDFRITASGALACGGTLTATLALQDGATNLGTVSFNFTTGVLVTNSQSFSNPAPIIIPDSGSAAPYPSTILVSGAPTTIQKVTVSFANMNHTFPGDVDILLVSPTGRKMIIVSDAGNTNDWVNANITVDDDATGLMAQNAAIPSGTYKPTNYGTGDTFPVPAPAGPYLTPATAGTDTLTSAFTGVAGGDPNGLWNLYVFDDAGGDLGNFNGGWSLTVTTITRVCCGPTASQSALSGRITTPDGQPLGGVSMNLSGTRSARTITDANGNYRFDNLDTGSFYTVTPALVNYHFGPAERSFSLIGNRTDATFTGTRDAVFSGNAIDTADFFVRQHYVDFLGREPDESGFNFWSDQILSCGGDAGCIERRTINVSAAYFLSIEFQETGGLVDGLYRASYNRRPLFAEFMPDTAIVARDVVVGRTDWARTLEANKQTFVDAWVQRPEFQAAYGGLSNEGYVAALISHTGVSFSQAERTRLVSGLSDGSSTRADVLRQIAENESFVSAKRNSTFVMMQYFGYLRRDPDESGFNFWLTKLNQFGGNFEQAEMVKAFLVSGEYRNRFRL
jgi:subtilisin-like proprotein convertase family protein